MSKVGKGDLGEIIYDEKCCKYVEFRTNLPLKGKKFANCRPGRKGLSEFTLPIASKS